MALKISKHDPSQPPPVIGPKSSNVVFAVIYVLMCLVTDIAVLSTMFFQTAEMKSGGLGVVGWLLFVVLCALVIKVLIGMLSVPLYYGKRWAYDLAFLSLLASPLFLLLGGLATTLPAGIFYVIGALNLALAVGALVVSPPKLT
ncbi:hypothetical protein MCEMSE15_01145 [Fimbriimonadaceae bacterium]